MEPILWIIGGFVFLLGFVIGSLCSIAMADRVATSLKKLGEQRETPH